MSVVWVKKKTFQISDLYLHRGTDALQKPASKRWSQAADPAQERHRPQRQLHPPRRVQPLPRQHQSGRENDFENVD